MVNRQGHGMFAATHFQTFTLAAVNTNETCYVGQKAF